MDESKPNPAIRPEDIESRSIRRRTFLGRFGAMAALSGLLGYTVGCEPTDSCDADEGDSPMGDSDTTDEPVVDSDFGDPCDSDGSDQPRSNPHSRSSQVKTDGAPRLESDALAWILGRPDSGDFVQHRLGRGWVHAEHADRHRFAGLLSLGQLDEILGTHAIRHPGVRLVRADQDVPVSEYVWRDHMVDPARVARLFAEGATVIFGALHDRHEGMRRLCSELTRQATARTQTNIYLTPPSSQGFKPHWDTHDVFVLQVEGSKLWRIYGGGPELPLQDDKFDPEKHAPGEVEAELTLEAGEVLYIPRGVMHAAVTTDAVSLHVTLGVMAYTWADLVVDCLSELADRSPAWRANAPFGLASRDPGGVQTAASLREMLDALVAEVDLGAVLAERQRAFDGVFRPRATDFLRQASASADLAQGDEVRWRTAGAGWLERRNGRAVLVSDGREVDFPGAAARTLESLLEGRAVRAGDLDDGLDWESRRVVLATLVREGFVGVTRHGSSR